ncbi:DEAD (Asp-Glu-Ala-Asp) box polypeptide 59 [Rhizopus azygosporus]|uniref:DEAD (Asp-Glu-Ala-Asp) box polypeptide 59 n=1 Tax=Rhizopus azygosporus TaxID=86630 RepID=A0A367JZK1_RHIAZ|nr:DEAD (Asp-Glu-Ala-Asp) box polypeptide 59 [Rhizopus azygosporus]
MTKTSRIEQEPIKQFSSEQRLAQDNEPVCVVCGKYAEYINSDTNQDICSLECKKINTDLNQKRLEKKRKKNIKNVEHGAMHAYAADNLHAKLTNYQEPESIGSQTKTHIQYMLKAHALEVSGTVIPKPLVTFDQLETILGPTLLRNIESLGWTMATGIQRQAITVGLAGRDLVAASPPKSGKTGAFLIPTLVHCRSLSTWDGDKRRAGPYALIMAPTREICCQIETICQRLALGMKNMRTALLIGGEPFPNQLYRLKKGVQILIGTPGRLLDLVTDHSNLLRLWKVQILVMDEADAMFRSGYGVQVRQILGKIKDDRNRQIMYFSSSLTEDDQILQGLLKRLKSPIEIKCTEA